MKKTIQITTNQLQKLIKEGVARLHKQALIENRINQINEELRIISEIGFDQDGNPMGFSSDYDEDSIKRFDRENSENPEEYLDPETGEKWIDPLSIRENEEVASPAMINTINGYLEAVLWTEEDELGPSNIESDVSFEAKVDTYIDIKKFKQLAGELIAQSGLDDEQIGHDLWLTRNGHGTGFWDRGLGEVGDKLSDIAREMGSKYAYVGDDGLIYID
jgi:hypothetical protein